ncbi:MAG: substrate-binding domain-containing protein [Methanolinea sp.]|nr:substrate-binding domain-containing protein [Methanolinea sp.]
MFLLEEGVVVNGMSLTRNQSLILLALAALVILGAAFAGCTTTQTPAGTPTATATPTQAVAKQKVLLATTTSLYDTGLLDYLKPMFEKKYNVELLITSQGTGKAIEVAKRGDCDILAVHSPSQEEAFMAGGNGLNRRCFAYNYFIIVGPANDPAGIKGMTPEDAFKKLVTLGKNSTAGVSFVSRGDNSGTHSAEKAIWKAAGYNYNVQIQKSGNWYIETGLGMGETLQLASQKQAYTLTDEGTYLAYKGNLDLVPVIEQGDVLLNVYSVITVYTPTQPSEKITMGNNFVNFLISPEIQTAIGEFGKDKYGKNLFTPMNGGCSQFNCDCTGVANATKPVTA